MAVDGWCRMEFVLDLDSSQRGMDPREGAVAGGGSRLRGGRAPAMDG